MFQDINSLHPQKITFPYAQNLRKMLVKHLTLSFYKPTAFAIAKVMTVTMYVA